MATVEFLGPIGKEPMQVDISTLSELKELLKGDEQLQKWLESSSVAVNDVMVSSLQTPINSSDKISLLPPVCGG